MIGSFAIPGDLGTRTGGYGYARRLLGLLEGTLGHVALPGSFPLPDADDVEETFELLAAARPPVLIDGLALGVLPADRLRALGKPVVGLCHHPLGLETGLSPERSAELIASETAALGACHRVVVTSAMTARVLVSDFGVPEARIAVAPPGTDPVPRAPGSGEAAVSLLSVGALVPRKGFLDLIEALGALKALDWHLMIAGSPDRDPGHAALIVRRIAEAGLERRIHLAGELDEEALARAYARADVFVLASQYEGYGMVFAEALARGLPVVGYDAGAVAEATATGGALLLPPGHVAGLGDALAGLIVDREAHAALAAKAWEGAARLPRWAGAADVVAETLREAMR